MSQAKGKFAKGTAVSAEKTFSDIRSLLKTYGATNFGLIENQTHFGVAFEIKNRRVRFIVPLPDRDEATRTNWAYNQYGSFKPGYDANRHEQLIKERWRAAYLVIKAKLESVETGIETFDEAFMGQLVLADGRTMAEWAKPQLDRLYSGGELPPLLPSGK